MGFRTQYSPKDRVYSNEGDRFVPEYSYVVTKEGCEELLPKGKKDIYEQIQSYREECDIKCIIARYLSGDETALAKYSPLFGDFAGAPSTLAEYQQAVLDAKEAFYQLPLDVRAKFNYDPNQFIAAYGSDKYNAIFNIKPAPQPAAQEEQQPAASEKGDEQ